MSLRELLNWHPRNGFMKLFCYEIMFLFGAYIFCNDFANEKRKLKKIKITKRHRTVKKSNKQKRQARTQNKYVGI